MIRGRNVLDLGAGDGDRAVYLRRMGPSHLVLVDKEDCVLWVEGDTVRYLFNAPKLHALAAALSPYVAHVAWPSNRHLPGLVKLLEGASEVIYVGTCTGGSFCGDTTLFDYFRTRKVLAYHPDTQNTLIVYGERTKMIRTRVFFEEWAAYHPNVVEFSDTLALRSLSDIPGGSYATETH